MNEATIQTIIEAVMGFLTGSVGATAIGVIIKSVITAISSAKLKKYAKLSEEERRLITADVQSGVLHTIEGGVVIDIDAQIDKATSKRITVIEQSQNSIIEHINTLVGYLRVVLLAIGDFKTISQSSKEQIKSLLNSAASSLEKVQTVEQPLLEIKQEPVEVATETTPQVPSVRY